MYGLLFKALAIAKKWSIKITGSRAKQTFLQYCIKASYQNEFPHVELQNILLVQIVVVLFGERMSENPQQYISTLNGNCIPHSGKERVL